MAKRSIEIDDKTLTTTGTLLGLVGSVFAAYLFLSSEFIDENELKISQAPQDEIQEKTKTNLNTRIIMSESTRYAQIAKYYRDEMQERDLTKAEKARLELVEREQCRLRNELSGTTSEICQ